MNKIYLILNFFLLTIFILFFSIIGVNKKTIDSFNNKNELETNKKNLRGLLWTNYSLIILTLIFSMFYIFKTGNYINNKPIIIFTILYILYLAFSDLIQVSGWTGIISGILSILIIQSMFLIIISLYVNKLYKETKNRPNYLIRKIV